MLDIGMSNDHKKAIADFRELLRQQDFDLVKMMNLAHCCCEPAFAAALDTMEAELAEAKQLLGEAACGDCGSNLRGRIEAFLTKGGV